MRYDERSTQHTQAKRHSFQPLLFAPLQGGDGLSRALPSPSALSGPASRPGNDHRARPDDAPRRRHESHVRLRVAEVAMQDTKTSRLAGNIEWLEAQELLDELCEEHLTLCMNLACLERATLDRARDGAAGVGQQRPVSSAMALLDDRVRDLGAVRDALAVLQQVTVSRSVHRALLPDAPLADYLRGIYAWMFAVVRALDQLVAGLRATRPDWASYRWRIEEAKNFHFDELEGGILEDLASLFTEAGDERSVMQLTAAFGELLERARGLEVRLDARLG